MNILKCWRVILTDGSERFVWAPRLDLAMEELGGDDGVLYLQLCEVRPVQEGPEGWLQLTIH